MRTGERKCIALPRITARLILAKDPTTVPSRNLGFSRNGAALVQDHPFAFGQVVLIYISGCSYLHQVCDRFLIFFFKLLKVEMYFLTSQTEPYSGFSKAIYTAGESFVLSLGLQE